MKNKKIKLVILIGVLVLGLVACGDPSLDREAGPESGKLKVVTTIFPSYDFVRELAGDRVELKMLIKPGTETHAYEPSPKDIIDIEESDLFIYVGGESDVWVEKILATMDKKDENLYRLMESVDLLEEELVEGMEEDEHDHEDHGDELSYDEHVWTSPKNAMKIVRDIESRLVSLDPSNRTSYESNYQAYLGQLEDLDRDLEDLVAHSKTRTLIFGDRFPFRYLVEDYGLKYYAAFPGCSEETEANPSTIKFLIDKVREEKVDSIFYIEFSSGKMADIIGEDSQAKKLLLHSGHNVSKEEFQEGIGYIDIFRANLESLKEALN